VDQLLALAVAVPLLAAAAISACAPLFRGRRRALDLAAIGTAAAVAAMLFVIMIRTADRDQVYWFAGFRPARGIVIGIDFEVQPLGMFLTGIGVFAMIVS
jgi:hypothetical protein